MYIAGIEKFSTIDYPKTPSFVIFTSGCNYNCWFCHNKHLIKQANNTIIGIVDLLNMISVRKHLLEGVVISGGECTLQNDIKHFCKYIKELGLKVKIDTNGSNPDILEELINLNLIDYVAVDYKCPFIMYQEVCDSPVDILSISRSIDILENSGIDYEIRTTLIPELREYELILMAKELITVKKWILKEFVEHDFIDKSIYNTYDKYEVFSMVDSIMDTLSNYQPNVILLK